MGGATSTPELNIVAFVDADRYGVPEERRKELAEKVVRLELQGARYVAESAAEEYEEYKKCYLKQAKEHTGCLKEYSFLKAKVEKHLAELAAEGGRDLANHYVKTTAAEAKTASA